jgi:hypothetical protein
VDVHDKLDQITALIEDARAMPMSASALINRAEVLIALDELRDLLPEQLHHADLLLNDREAVVEQGRSAAEQLVTAGQAEHDRLVEQTEIVKAARERAAALEREAAAEAHRLRTEADHYVDSRLADFEVALAKLTQQVQRGRERLVERRSGHSTSPNVTDDELLDLDAAQQPAQHGR